MATASPDRVQAILEEIFLSLKTELSESGSTLFKYYVRAQRFPEIKDLSGISEEKKKSKRTYVCLICAIQELGSIPSCIRERLLRYPETQHWEYGDLLRALQPYIVPGKHVKSCLQRNTPNLISHLASVHGILVNEQGLPNPTTVGDDLERTAEAEGKEKGNTPAGGKSTKRSNNMRASMPPTTLTTPTLKGGASSPASTEVEGGVQTEVRPAKKQKRTSTVLSPPKKGGSDEEKYDTLVQLLSSFVASNNLTASVLDTAEMRALIDALLPEGISLPLSQFEQAVQSHRSSMQAKEGKNIDPSLVGDALTIALDVVQERPRKSYLFADVTYLTPSFTFEKRSLVSAPLSSKTDAAIASLVTTALDETQLGGRVMSVISRFGKVPTELTSLPTTAVASVSDTSVCVAHNINLAVQEAMTASSKKFKSVRDLLITCTAVGGHTVGGESNGDAGVFIPTSVKTRWKSTYYQLKTVMENRKEVDAFLSLRGGDSRIGHLHGVLAALVEVLEVVVSGTERQHQDVRMWNLSHALNTVAYLCHDLIVKCSQLDKSIAEGERQSGRQGSALQVGAFFAHSIIERLSDSVTFLLPPSYCFQVGGGGTGMHSSRLPSGRRKAAAERLADTLANVEENVTKTRRLHALASLWLDIRNNLECFLTVILSVSYFKAWSAVERERRKGGEAQVEVEMEVEVGPEIGEGEKWSGSVFEQEEQLIALASALFTSVQEELKALFQTVRLTKSEMDDLIAIKNEESDMGMGLLMSPAQKGVGRAGGAASSSPTSETTTAASPQSAGTFSSPPVDEGTIREYILSQMRRENSRRNIAFKSTVSKEAGEGSLDGLTTVDTFHLFLKVGKKLVRTQSPFDYWREPGRSPLMARIARMFLGVCGAEMDSEKVFTLAGLSRKLRKRRVGVKMGNEGSAFDVDAEEREKVVQRFRKVYSLPDVDTDEVEIGIDILSQLSWLSDVEYEEDVIE